MPVTDWGASTDLRPLRRRFNAMSMQMRIYPPPDLSEPRVPWARAMGLAVLSVLLLGLLGVWS